MIIDAHVHFWNFNPVRDSWITNNMKVIQRDFTPLDIEPLLKKHEVLGCMAVQADQSDAETQFLLALADKNPVIKGVVGWIDLKSNTIEEQLEKYSHQEKLKGFRHISEGEASGFLIGDNFVNGISALKGYGYTYDILIKHHQLQEAIALVNKLPHQHFVLDHCGKPDLTATDSKTWETHIKTIAQNPNVYCKLSGLLTQCDWHNCKESDIFKCLDVIFGSFGTGRVLYASDWPVMLLAGNYSQWLTLIKKYTNRFSLDEQEMIFFKNTNRFYNL